MQKTFTSSFLVTVRPAALICCTVYLLDLIYSSKASESVMLYNEMLSRVTGLFFFGTE